MKKKSVCYIFGAGERTEPPRPDRGDFVIAADGGYDYLRDSGIPANLIIGDFDSLQGSLPSGIKTVTLPKEKDETDMCAALRAGMRRGYYTFHIYGGLGGRIDHSLANIQLIADIAGSGARGYLFGRDTVITAISNGNISFAKTSSGTVSVFSHTDTSDGVYETGMKYALFNATLQNGFPKGISNEFTDKAASISVRSGTLIIMYPPGAQVI